MVDFSVWSSTGELNEVMWFFSSYKVIYENIFTFLPHLNIDPSCTKLGISKPHILILWSSDLICASLHQEQISRKNFSLGLFLGLIAAWKVLL